jgi:hypothetical protein
MTLEERLEQFDEEFLKFDRIELKLSQRPDLHAFILLDMLLPNPGSDMVSAAEHDVIYLDVDSEKLNEVATDDQLRDLSRCGVHYDGDGDGLAMFA